MTILVEGIVIFCIGCFVIFTAVNFYRIMPKNNLSECQKQFKETNRIKAGFEFCDCIHKNGEILSKCLEVYEKAQDDALTK
jgi:hypothetical protein